MSSRLIPEPLYHPSGGINLDANGLVARPNECVDGVNIDIDTDRVVQRGGTKAFPVPTEIGPVLKFHRYIHPTRGDLLFAFCGTNIYQYDDTFGWKSIYFGAAFSVNSWSVTNVVDREMGSTVVAAGCTYTRPTEGYDDQSSRVLLIYDNQNSFTLYDITNAVDYGYFFFPDYTMSTDGDVEVVFYVAAAASSNGYVAVYSDQTHAKYLGIYVSTTNEELRLVCGGSGDYVAIPLVRDTVISARVTADGSAFYNGIYKGSTGAAITLTDTSPFMVFSGFYTGGLGASNVYVRTLIIEGDTYVGQANKYFESIVDGTRIFSQYNSLFATSSAYKWTLSSNGTNEYYLTTNADGDPGIGEPTSLWWNTASSNAAYKLGTEMAIGVVGSLSSGEWDWGDNETVPLGFNTVYFRTPLNSTPVYSAYAVRLYDGSTTSPYNSYAGSNDSGEILDIAFIDMELKRNLYEDAVYTTAIDSDTPPETQTLTLDVDTAVAEERVIVSGTAYLVVDTIGVVATAGLAERTIEGSPTIDRVNFFLPVDEDEISFGENSYIDLDTGDISIEWLKDTYDGLDLHIYYQYEDDVEYKPLHVTNYHNALVMANTAEHYTTDTSPLTQEWVYTPWRVRWSEQGNIRLFKGSHYQDLALADITPILGMQALETEAASTIIGPLYFLKHNSIVRGTYNQAYNLYPDTPVPMFNFEIASSEGMESVGTATIIDGTMFYLGRNDVFAFNGINRVSLTKDYQNRNTRVQRAIASNLNVNYLYRNFGLYDEVNRKYYLFIVTNGSTSFYPEDAYVYDIDGQYWVRHTYTQVSAAIEIETAFGGTIDSLEGSIDSLGATHIDDLSSNAVKTLLFSIGDYTYYGTKSAIDEQDINDVTVESYFITRDFLGTSLEEKDRIEKVMIEANGGEIDLAYNTKYSTLPADFLQEDTFSFTSGYETKSYHPDVVSTATRFLVTLRNNSIFRWLQVFSNKQELIGE